MSLISDALKKAQSGRLTRRYLNPDPSGALPVAREIPSDKAFSISAVQNWVQQASPTLWIGLGSGLLLFGLLFMYFFYARDAKPSVAAARPVPLVLTPPPVVPAEELVPLEKDGPVAATPATPGAQEAVPPAPPEPYEEEAHPRSLAAKRKAEPAVEVPREPRTSEVSVAPTLSEEARHRFNLAVSYQEDGNFSRARAEYEELLGLWPLYAEARNNLGVVYKELGMFDEGIAEMKKALALNPRYAKAYHNLGVMFHLKGDLSQARHNYETALSLHPKHLGSLNNLALVYRAQTRTDEARALLEKGLAIDAAYPQTHYNLAILLEEAGASDRARFHYQRFVDLSGNENSRLVERVRAHLQQLASR